MTIPCGNVWNFTSDGFKLWGTGSQGQTVRMGAQSRTYHLKSTNGRDQAWEITVSKKLQSVLVTQTNGRTVNVYITKSIACTKPAAYNVAGCCSKKDVLYGKHHQMNFTAASQKRLMQLLSEL